MASYHRVFSSFFALRLDFRRFSGGLAVNRLSMVELLTKAQIWYYCCQGEQNQNDELASQASNCKGSVWRSAAADEPGRRHPSSADPLHSG